MNLSSEPFSMKKIVILISGRGSNMQAIVSKIIQEGWSVEVACVISNRPAAEGLLFAKQHGIATAVVDHTNFSDREAFDQALSAVIDGYVPDLVVLAGFMRLLTPGFVGRYVGHLVNIHPSLLPDYKGLNTHARVLDAGEKRHGATVHWVDEALDHGATIDQASLDILPTDSPESLAERVLVLEHELYPKVIKQILFA
jgi:phosphoribosylglycinamide formyltransferase 1